MKAAKGNVYKLAKVVVNTNRKDRHQWAKIVVDGRIVHTGQTSYIKKLARDKYNLDVEI